MFELAPWRPMRDLATLRKEMDKVWENFFGREEFWPWPREGEWTPAIDVSETDTEIIVKADLPGMDAKDINISLCGDMLTIKGERKQETEEKKENYHRIESRYGAFSRTFRLPVAVDSEKIEAAYKKGILKVTLPKKEEAKAKQIEVK